MSGGAQYTRKPLCMVVVKRADLATIYYRLTETVELG